MPRPKGQSHTRQHLIEAARDCFVQYGYERVSTRKIAKQAGVDAAMIRYYFGSKAALFEAMVLETVAPMLSTLSQPQRLAKVKNPFDLMCIYYQIMSEHPELPKLFLAIMHQSEGDEAFGIMAKIFDGVQASIRQWFKQDTPNWSLQEGVDPDLARFSMIGLMVFPFITSGHIAKEFGVEKSMEWLEKLAQHNDNLLRNGIFQIKGNTTEE